MYEYKTQKELFKSLIPAFNVKIRLLKNNNYYNVTKKDIWDYLKINKWRSSVDLTIADMVNDIIHVDNKEIDIYLRNHKKGYE